MEDEISGEDSALAAPPCRDSVLSPLLGVVGVGGELTVYQQEKQENKDREIFFCLKNNFQNSTDVKCKAHPLTQLPFQILLLPFKTLILLGNISQTLLFLTPLFLVVLDEPQKPLLMMSTLSMELV